MKKKFLVMALILAFAGTLAYLYKNNQGQPYVPVSAPKPLDLTLDREGLEEQIMQALEEANYCNNRKECKIVDYGCPFGCSNLVNVNHDLQYIQEGVAYHRKNDWSCYYGGCFGPKIEDIDCIDHRCVDTRSFEKP